MSIIKQNLFQHWAKMSPEHQSALLMVAGISILGVSDNFVPYASDHIGLGQFHFMRSLMALICVVCLARLTQTSLWPLSWRAVIVRTTLLAISMGLFFSVLSFLPVAVAGAGLFTSPLFVLVFSVILFGLKPGWRRILAMLTGSAGVFLILRPDSLDFQLLQLLPVLAGAFYALSSIVTKRLCADESPLALVAAYFAFLCGGGLLWAVGMPFLINGPVSPEAEFMFRGLAPVPPGIWVWLAVMAVLTVLAIWMLVRAYQIAETSYAVMYEYSYLISAGLVGIVLWQAEFSLSSLAGMGLIVLSGFIITVATAKM